ncbi:MAG: hypothetical protein KDB03_05870 [Planctomycetales bacterium]|nr:hypothetical protein [Planctomycetales bacterium]
MNSLKIIKISIVLSLHLSACLIARAQSKLNPKEVFVLSGHGGEVQALAFNPRGQVLCSGGGEGDAIWWNFAAILDSVKKGSVVLSGSTSAYEVQRKHVAERISAISCNKLEVLAISGVTHWGNGFGSSLEVYTQFQPEPLTFGGNAAWSFTSVDIHSQSAYILMGGNNNELKAVSLLQKLDNKGKVVPNRITKIAPNIPDQVWRVAIHPRESLVVAAGRNGWIKYYSVSPIGLDPKVVANDPSHQNRAGIVGLKFSRDGRSLLSLDSSGELHVSNIFDGETKQQYNGLGKLPGWLDIHPTESWALIPSMDGSCRIIDISTGAKLAEFAHHEGGANVAVFAPDGCFVATGGKDHKIRIWDLGIQQPKKSRR